MLIFSFSSIEGVLLYNLFIYLYYFLRLLFVSRLLFVFEKKVVVCSNISFFLFCCGRVRGNFFPRTCFGDLLSNKKTKHLAKISDNDTPTAPYIPNCPTKNVHFPESNLTAIFYFWITSPCPSNPNNSSNR